MAAEVEDYTEKLNSGDGDEHTSESKQKEEQITLYSLFNDISNYIFFPAEDNDNESTTFLHRIKTCASQNWPLLPEASRNTGRDVLLWTRRGTALRSLLVVSVGTVTFLALTGFLVFMLFFFVATVNAIVISFLLSLVAVGIFLAFFFACVTAIYVVALSVAAFVISTASISAIIATIFLAGWVAFIYCIWLLIKKSVDLASQSLSISGSAVSAFSSTRHAHTHHEPDIVSDDILVH